MTAFCQRSELALQQKVWPASKVPSSTRSGRASRRACESCIGTERANLDDSLKVLSNAADLDEHADDPNRRLCNQALFKAVYIDEDNDVRVGYRNSYDGLSVPSLQADALSWAAQAKRNNLAGTATKGGALVASSHLTHLG